MSFQLNKPEGKRRMGALAAVARMRPYLRGEGRRIAISAVAVAVNTASTLSAPLIVGYAIDHFVRSANLPALFLFALLLFGVFLAGLAASYALTVNMGTVGRNVLWKMRNAIFGKLQELPLAFFNENQSGDLISRINNDTDKLNQLFAQVLMQLVGNIFLMVGGVALILALNPKLGAASLVPAAAVFAITALTGAWVREKNLKSMRSLGELSAEVQESLANFRVIAAFNRSDYFREKFAAANARNYGAAIGAGIANGIYSPIYSLASAAAQGIALLYGLNLVLGGGMSVGLLISFFLYVNGFYAPLRQIAAVWASLQTSLASLDRIYEVLSLSSGMPQVVAEPAESRALLEFREVTFGYEVGQEILRDVSFSLERGKTYALVGPTGGGKTTTASLMARLYDPMRGTVILDNRDIRSYTPEERAKRIGFILQDPFLFTGTLRENALYGNPELKDVSQEELMAQLGSLGLSGLIDRFPEGLDTKVVPGGDGLSLGQKQIVAFIRAILRRPELLILDEATANIDTVTERQLEEIIAKLPLATTKVIIAHRLNTIRSADEIFFVNVGEVVRAGSMEHAVEMLMKGRRKS